MQNGHINIDFGREIVANSVIGVAEAHPRFQEKFKMLTMFLGRVTLARHNHMY